MSYRIGVVDAKDRKVQIDALVARKTQSDPVNFRDRQELFPVIQLPIHVPIYRMRNGRTSVVQLEVIHDKGYSGNFFSDGEENPTAQEAQHALLLKMSKSSSRNIYDELERVRLQRERLLITSHGVVVNGNRRLAAMRDLYYGDTKTYSNFAQVDVVVLPEYATELDIEIIEVEEQLVPETKQPYGWIERLLKIREHSNDPRIPRDMLLKKYRIPNEKELVRLQRRLDLVDNYLERYLKKPGEYYLVSDNQQAFGDLQKAMDSNTGNAQLQEYMELIAFPMIKESRKLQTRLYDYNEAFSRHASRIIDELIDQGRSTSQPLAIPDQDTSEEVSTDDDDPFSGFGSFESDKLHNLRETLLDAEQSSEVVQNITTIYKTIHQQELDENRSSEAFRDIEKATQIVLGVNLIGSDPSTHEKMHALLGMLDSKVKRLSAELDHRIKASKKGDL